MVNYNDPATIAREFLALVKLWHVMNGIYIWEFFTTVYYEWDVIRGRRPYQRAIWIYSIARASALMAIIFNMVGLDTTTPINCEVYAVSEVTFFYLSFVASSLLIILRIIAIWNKQTIVVVVSMAIWVAEIGFLVNSAARFHSTWSYEANACQLLIDFKSTKLGTAATLFTDVVLLLIMLIGLFRMRLRAGGAFGLGRFLWSQGLIWLLIATVAEVPPVVFVFLNLNEPLGIMFQTPCLIIVTIAATRMYRSLINFHSSEMSQDTPLSPLGSKRAVSTIRVRSGPIPLKQMEVSVRTEHDQFLNSYVSTDQGRYKAHELSLHGDVETGPEK